MIHLSTAKSGCSLQKLSVKSVCYITRNKIGKKLLSYFANCRFYSVVFIMVFCDCMSWAIVLVFLYFVVRKVLSLLRIDRYTDVYVLITGCDTGFGNEAARRFHRFGCHVFAGCLTEQARENLKRECSDRLHAISLDVTKPESIKEAYEYVKANLPKGRGLWGVVNNAGIFGKLGSLEWFHLDDYRHVLDINLYGLIDVTMTFLPLVKREKGRIVNTASVLGRYSLTGCTPYCISKYGVEAFTDGLRRSLRPFGVKAILVEPGCHRTQMTSKFNVTDQIKAAWEGASAEVKADFGEKFWKEYTEFVNESLEKFSAHNKITDVVDAYEQGVLGRFPRARYPVGFDTNLFFLPLQAMPEWIGDWVAMKMGNGPKPKIIQ